MSPLSLVPQNSVSLIEIVGASVWDGYVLEDDCCVGARHMRTPGRRSTCFDARLLDNRRWDLLSPAAGGRRWNLRFRQPVERFKCIHTDSCTVIGCNIGRTRRKKMVITLFIALASQHILIRAATVNTAVLRTHSHPQRITFLTTH